MTIRSLFITKIIELVSKIQILNKYLFSLRRRFFDYLQKWILHRGLYILSMKDFFKNHLDNINYNIIYPAMEIPYSQKDMEFLSKINWNVFAGGREKKYKTFPEVFSCVLRDIKFFGISGGIGIKNKVFAESVRGKGGLPELWYGDHILLPHYRKNGLYTSIMLLDWSRSNIYHWLIDCMPRLMAITQIKETKINFIINQDITPYQLETLKFFLNDRFELTRINSNAIWEVEKYFFSSIVPSGTGYVPPLFLEFVRDKVLQNYGIIEKKPKTRIYISRLKAKKGRKVENEAEILKVLEKFNFQRIFAEDFTFKEQVEIIRSAEIIVSPHGQALALMIFANNAKVLELFPPWTEGPRKIPSPMCFMLAKSMGFDYQFLIGDKLFEKKNFYLNSFDLEKKLTQMSI